MAETFRLRIYDRLPGSIYAGTLTLHENPQKSTNVIKYTQHTTDPYRTWQWFTPFLIMPPPNLVIYMDANPHIVTPSKSREKKSPSILQVGLKHFWTVLPTGKFKIPHHFLHQKDEYLVKFSEAGDPWVVKGEIPFPWANSGDRIFCRVITPDAGEFVTKNAQKVGYNSHIVTIDPSTSWDIQGYGVFDPSVWADFLTSEASPSYSSLHVRSLRYVLWMDSIASWRLIFGGLLPLFSDPWDEDWCIYPKNPGLSWDILRMGLEPLIPL